MADLTTLRTDLANVDIALAPGKTFALPPAGHWVMSENLQLLADTGISLAPAEGGGTDRL